MRIGVILFDDPQAISNGWSAVDGDSYAKRVRGAEDLASDTLWFTNLEFDHVRNSALSQNAYFRHHDYFGLKLSDLCAELGLTDAFSVTPDQLALKLVQLYSRFIDFECALSGQSRDKWRAHPITARGSLRENFWGIDQLGDDHLREAVDESIQMYTSCDSRGFWDGYEHVKFYLPRLEHARRILSMPVPLSNEYERVKRRPRKGEDISEWLMGQEGPVLAHTVIHSLDADMSTVLNFGAAPPSKSIEEKGRLRTHTSTRQWMTTLDLMTLNGFADLEIKEAIVFPRTMPLIRQPEIMRFFELSEEIDALSYTVGIFATNLWTAMSRTHARASMRKHAMNARVPFLRAVDRWECMKVAKVIMDMGYGVMGYGAGRVHARMPELSLGDIAQVSLQTELMPPMLNTGGQGHEMFTERKPWDMMMKILTEGRSDEVMDADAMIVSDWLERRLRESQN